MTEAEQRFEEILRHAREDPDVLAFWLGGSRGKGRASVHSDHDCVLIVRDEAAETYGKRLAPSPGLDLQITTLGEFETAALWGRPDDGDGYSYAHVSPLVDKTGRIAGLMAEKACVPEAEADGFIRASLDHFVNQIYRALKCLRDDDPVAARLEAAEAAAPLLDALFALNGRRLKPYYKYLAWELGAHPLALCPRDADTLPAKLVTLSTDTEGWIHRELLAEAARLFRAEGFGAVFDAWGEALDWMLA